MIQHKPKRNRGVILTDLGWKKLQNARLELENEKNFGEKYTIEELSAYTGLTSITLSKVIACEERVDKRTLTDVFNGFNLELNPSDYYYQQNLDFERVEHAITDLQLSWGEAIDVTSFYGRAEELIKLHQWLLDDGCRLVTLLGMGGIGKTSLSIKLAKQIQNKFNYVIWRSLHNAPLLKDILADLIQFLSNGQETQTNAGKTNSYRVSQLIKYLQFHRCLIVLDNAQVILQSGAYAGHYRKGYEDYGHLLRQIGEIPHQSCLLLTSREKPKEVASLEGEVLPVRSLQLNGLNQAEAQKIFQHKKLFASDEEWKKLIECYAGNPSQLKIVATTIQDIFGGDISEFLQQNTTVFGDICELLGQQFERLSNLEKEVMYWLAINRKPITLSELRADTVSQVSQQRLLEALESLRRRSLLEKSKAFFTLQPLMMDYVTARLIELVCEEICTQNIELFRNHALLKAQAKDDVMKAQTHFIIQPLIDGLLTIFKSKRGIENRLNKILAAQRLQSPLELGYTIGNIFNLLKHLNTDFTGYDFSNLSVWQADLRGCNLHQVNFAHADLAKSVFTKTFNSIYSLAFSPDGTLVVSSDADGEIWLWRIFANGEQLLTFEGHVGSVKSTVYSSVNTTDDDNTVIMGENFSNDNYLNSLPRLPDGVRIVAFSPDGRTLAAACVNRTVKLWDVSAGSCRNILQGHTGLVKCLAFSPEEQILASGGDDKTVRLWSVSDGMCLKVLEHSNGVWSVAFSRKSRTLASGCDDQKVYLWNVRTGICCKILQGHTGWVLSVTFSTQDNILASGSKDKTIKLWDFYTGECLKTLEGHTDWVLSVAFSPDGKTIASGSIDQTVRLWDVSTGQCFETLEGHTGWIRSVAFSPQGNMLVSGSEDKTVKLWDVLTGECLATLTNSRPYEGMNINGITGVAPETIASLKVLGAFELQDARYKS